MNKDSNKLETGSKVAIIGGGPAGSFFALYLLHYARERGIQPDITIYQQRNFDELGPKGCKGCAGILSMSLLQNLDELGLTIPEEIIQNKIDHYVVHSPYTLISISNPEKEIQIVSVHRGGGPRVSHYENAISFDGWLLREAQRQGVKTENQRVSRIYLEQETGIEVEGKQLKYDLVVGASGVNTEPIPIVGLQYIPPKTRIMAQDELYAGTTQVESRLGNTAHVFMIPHSGLIFGTLVPKGPFINISILSSGEQPVSVTDFLRYDIVRKVLPDHYERTCGCRPRVVVGSAHNYHTDRFVAIGDAVVSRLYKDGIGSSLLTARQAAHTAVYNGIAHENFKRYYQPFCHAIERDNLWGQRLFLTNNRAKDSRVFFLTQQRLIAGEQSNTKGPQPFTKAAWGMSTRTYSYTSRDRFPLGPAAPLKQLTVLLWEG